jgi:hypothetical protein
MRAAAPRDLERLKLERIRRYSVSYVAYRNHNMAARRAADKPNSENER